MKKDIQYDWTQIRELELARRAEVDTSAMENPQYLAEQMQEIRLGLEAGIDVSVYAKPEFDWFQMQEIRLGLEEKVDVSQYAFSTYSHETMKQLRLAWHTFTDLTPYVEKGFEGEELEAIRLALEKELPIGKWITEDMYVHQIRQISLGLEQGLDISYYADTRFSWRQMQEIRYGLEHRLDVAVYAKILMKSEQMAEVRYGLEAGLDVSSYASMMYTSAEMRSKRLALLADQEVPREPIPDMEASIAVQNHRQPVNLIVEEQGLKAYLYIEGNHRETFTTDELRRELRKNGIVFGILEEALDEIANGKMYGNKVLVAEGMPEESGQDGWYEFFVKTDAGFTPVLLPDGSIDYTGFKAYETVEAGQKLAVYHYATQGKPGKDLFGNVIPAEQGEEKSTLRGNGFVLEEDKVTYRASRNGRFEFKNHKIEISNVVDIQEDVTAVFGKVVIDGTVHVRGNVLSGGYIEATGDILVDGYVEAARLKAGESVIIRNGACSGQETYVEAGEKVAARFLEGAYIQAKGNIHANSVMNSQIETLGKVIVSGKKGSIIGGRISAVRGVETYNIGNETAITTVIDTGKNDLYHKYMQMFDKQKEKIQEDIRIFEEGLQKISRYDEKTKEAYKDITGKLKLGIKMKEEELVDIEGRWEKHVNYVVKTNKQPVVARGRAYMGTVVMVDRVSYTLPQDIERVIFTKRNRNVVMLKL